MILLAVRLFLLTLACMLPFLGGLIIFALFYQLLISRIIMVLLLIVSFFLILRMTLDYSQIFLLYLYNPYLSCREIMHQSKNLMKGNRIRYFYLLVSLTEVEFYRDLINEHSQEF